MKQRDLFNNRPSRVPGAAQQTPAKQPYVIEPFEFDGLDPRLVPQPDAVIPDEIKLPTDNPEWMPEKA